MLDEERERERYHCFWLSLLTMEANLLPCAAARLIASALLSKIPAEVNTEEDAVVIAEFATSESKA